MTEPDQPDPTGETRTNLEEVLDSFKADTDAADTEHVSDPPGSQPRLNWRPVTELGEQSPTPEVAPRRRSGFQFDLGGALSRLGGGRDGGDSSPPIVERPTAPNEPLPQRGSGTSIRPSGGEPVPSQPAEGLSPLPPLPRRGSEPEPVSARRLVEAVPEIYEATPTEYAPSARQAVPGSVFTDSSVSTMPTLPAHPVVHSGRTAPAPVLQTGGLLPTLPTATPAAPPMISPVIESAPSTPDINALRSAQLRASRQQRQGKMFGRTLLVVLVIGGAIAASLVFGRAYLFPTKWNPELTPIVDEIQLAAGAEFEHTVLLVVQPADEYAVTVARLTLGETWTTRVAEWRALGLASGDPTSATVGAALVPRSPVVFDPAADTIYRSADADLEGIKPDMRTVLESVFARQQSDQAVGDVIVAAGTSGFTGVSSPQVLAEHAVNRFVAGSSRSGTSSTPEAVAVTDLPIPIAYQLAATDLLGEAVLLEAGADPAAVVAGDYPEGVYAALNDNPQNTTGVVLGPGETSIADPVSLGVDDWSLVWGARLPSITVNRLVAVLTADSYRPIDRAGTTCAVGVFQSANEADGAFLLGAMQTWAATAPSAAQVTVTALGTSRVQLVTCDPGAESATVPDPSTVDGLIQRQLARLAR